MYIHVHIYIYIYVHIYICVFAYTYITCIHAYVYLSLYLCATLMAANMQPPHASNNASDNTTVGEHNPPRDQATDRPTNQPTDRPPARSPAQRCTLLLILDPGTLSSRVCMDRFPHDAVPDPGLTVWVGGTDAAARARGRRRRRRLGARPDGDLQGSVGFLLRRYSRNRWPRRPGHGRKGRRDRGRSVYRRRHCSTAPAREPSVGMPAGRRDLAAM